jgi:hypothetical protein
MAARHPDVVLRLFSEALSMQGRVQAMESRFWNKMEFVPPKSLVGLWNAREQIKFTPLGLFAVVVNEFANGNIIRRPWGAAIGAPALIEVLRMGLLNTSYLMMRSYKGGVDEKPIQRAFAYLILCALDVLPAENVTRLINDSIYRDQGNTMPENVKEFCFIARTSGWVPANFDLLTFYGF